MLKIYASIFIELGNDEVYYTLYARDLQWSYFDHPPLVGLSIFISTLGGFIKSDFLVRLIPMILGSVNVFIVYKSIQEISNEATAKAAALLFSSSFYVQILCGFFILPDSILLTCLILAFRMLNRIYLLSDDAVSNWIYLGCFFGLGFLSKYSVVFFIFGLFVYTIVYKREFLLSYKIWLSLLIFLLFIMPVLYWNYANDFISFRFHENRVGSDDRIRFVFLLREILGGFFYNNPILILLMIVFVNRKNWIRQEVKHLEMIRLYLFGNIPIIVFFVFVSLTKPTLPHWAAPGYTLLIIPLSFLLAKKLEYIKWVLLFFLIVFLIAPLFVRFYQFPINTNPSNEKQLGSNDFTLDLCGWENLGDSIQSWMSSKNGKSKLNNESAFVVDKWFPGAHIQYYVADKLSWPTYGVGSISEIHQFYFFNAQLTKIDDVENLYYLTTSRLYQDPFIKPYFKEVMLIKKFPIIKSEKTCAWAFLFKVKLVQ